jgi:polysaccharide pyruvyl transferase
VPHIGVLSYADTRNFGDVLFPLIVQSEIQSRIPNARITFITPTGSAFAGMDSIKFGEVDLEQFDALVLGGGELVHRMDAMLTGIYERFGLTAIDHPTDLVFRWTQARSPFKSWLALGVPAGTSAQASADIVEASCSLDMIGVRGTHSRARLIDYGVDHRRVRRSPDLGWLFPRLLQDQGPVAHPAGGEPYVVVQATGFPDPAAVAQDVRTFAEEQGLRVVLLPLTRCWEDWRPLTELQKASRGAFVLVDNDMDDLDKLAILGGATMYLGQSLHGFVAAASQNRPAGLVAPFAPDKFDELLGDLRLRQLRCPSWDAVDGLAHVLLWTPPAALSQVRVTTELALRDLFDDLCSAICARVDSRGARVSA